ncbi:MAG: trans-sulfuration enzyme family protein [Spirochaetota bacterium]
MKENTTAVHVGSFPSYEEGGINTPIYASSAHFFPHPSGEVRYPRLMNIPTQSAPAEKIARLENAGAGMVFSSGMAAITTTVLAFVQKGEHCIFQSNIYGGSFEFVTKELPRCGIEASLVGSYATEEFVNKIKQNTRLVYIESPSNPLLRLVDIQEIANECRERGIISIIDNTFATPINQKPLDMGIDMVVHSGTKYLNGHSDIACGAVVSDQEKISRIKKTAYNLGGSLDVFSSFLLDRGLKTLPLRVHKQNENASKIARYLEQADWIEKVYYPGLAGHPDHSLAGKQMKGFGGIVTFDMKGSLPTARKFTQSLNIIKNAISLGGVESTLCFPFETSHVELSKQEREASGIYETTVRVSVGIEDPEDLIEDMENAAGSS